MFNQVVMVGFLHKFPETRLEQRGGQRYIRVRLGVKRVWTDLEGERQSDTLFHTVEAWGTPAEILAEVKSGEQVLVEGWYKTWVADTELELTGQITQGPRAGQAETISGTYRKFHATLIAQLVLRTGRPGGLSRGETQVLQAAVLDLSEAEVQVVTRALATRAARKQQQTAAGR